MGKTITRKINFYKIEFKRNNRTVDPHPIFSKINEMAFNKNGRYFNLSNGESWSMEVDSLNRFNIKMGTIRRTNLPMIEKSGEKQPLTMPPNSGLYEPMHFNIYEYSNSGEPVVIGGFEYNHYGPKANHIGRYLEEKTPSLVDKVNLLPLMRRDVNKLLSNVGEIRLFDLRVQNDMGELLKDLDESLYKAFENMKQFEESKRIQIILRGEKYARRGLNLPFFDKIGDWLSRDEVRNNVERAKIRGRDKRNEKIKKFDLLQEYLMRSKQVIKQDENHRIVKSKPMYAAINEAHEELKGEIEEIVLYPENLEDQ